MASSILLVVNLLDSLCSDCDLLTFFDLLCTAHYSCLIYNRLAHFKSMLGNDDIQRQQNPIT